MPCTSKRAEAFHRLSLSPFTLSLPSWSAVQPNLRTTCADARGLMARCVLRTE